MRHLNVVMLRSGNELKVYSENDEKKDEVNEGGQT